MLVNYVKRRIIFPTSIWENGSNKKLKSISLFGIEKKQKVFFFKYHTLHSFICFIVVQLQLPHFFPIVLPCPTHHPAPTVNLHPVVHAHGSFIHVPWLAFFLLSQLPPSPLPSGHCQFVLYVHVFGSILVNCLFCLLCSTYRWDHMVFVFHCLAYFT